MAMVCFLRQNSTVNAQAGENASHFQCPERACIGSCSNSSHVTPGMPANAAEQVDAAIKTAKKPAIE
ncbi:hypothetical protein GFL39_19220 [Rhizobium leguminosarum bv. viciae]|nr:hypothetical protein [Rhizobium leguminosarum bv. viciae]NKL87785.1 hypothetical protein [Rhizobium leguminosarum bv. viciae]NKL91449.1 hypothetical protein [Rhizobium leguminosarum bv. viciae]NKM91772.1 hypothetical protein [Rhizobium leguminosarum bv. viciae]